MITRLRAAVRGDLKLISGWIADERACRDWAGPLVRYPLDAATLAADIALDSHASYSLVDESGDLLGFGQLMRMRDGRRHLARILVRPELRRKGLGRTLCELLMAAAREEHDRCEITLWVSRDNQPAVALYSALGFVRVAAATAGRDADESLLMFLSTGPSLQLRDTTEPELEQIYDLEQQPGVADFIIPYSPERHRRELSNPRVAYKSVLNQQEALVGFVILALDPDEGSLEFRRVVIGPKGKGYGKQVVRLIDLVAEHELERRRIWLDVFEDNARGRHIYESAGYRQFATAQHGGRTLCLYEKSLI